ncbi:MAG: radical SAM protein [Planctomycetes bacterium]|nr:radical SAM protein [Planctomycetota bacterium]
MTLLNPTLAPTLPPGHDAALDAIEAKVLGGIRLSEEEGLRLYETRDLHRVLALADLVRRRLHGKRAFYNVNRHINYSNVCALSCKFCAFHRKKGQEGAYEKTAQDIAGETAAAAAAGATEIHMVGGLHPWLPFEWYLDVLRAMKAAAPGIHIKAFTAVEIVHLQRVSKRGGEDYEGIKAVLRDLMNAGLGSLPGGGAEVFDDRVHDEAFKGKIRGDHWLDVHRAAHELGLNSNATMLYGHIDRRPERLHHLGLLRAQQDFTLRGWARAQGIRMKHPDEVVLTGPEEFYPRQRLPMAGHEGLSTGYFQTIIPLPFYPNESELEHLPAPTGIENLRTLAIARLMLDNFPHVKAFWIMQTLPMAELMLGAGADDLDGTVVWYDITKAVGEGNHQETSVHDLVRAIRNAGCEPVERDTLYRRVDRDGATWSLSGTS